MHGRLFAKESGLLQFYSQLDPKHWVDYRRLSSWTIDEGDLEREDASRKVVLDRVMSTLRLMGGVVAGSQNPRLNRWQTFQRWPYFGHVTPKDFSEGFFKDLDALQGKNGTYYAGGAATFELVEAVICSAKYAVERLDADLRADSAFGGPDERPGDSGEPSLVDPVSGQHDDPTIPN